MSSEPKRLDAPSSLAISVASMPWAFSQQHPLDTAEFIREAQRRGVPLDALALRELYRLGLLVPFVTVTGLPEPIRAVTRLADLRSARNEGRLRDLAPEPYRPRLRFDRAKMSDPRGWWNGHIYSWYQLLVLPVVEPLLMRARYHRRGKRLYPTLKEPWQPTKDEAERLRRIAAVLTAPDPPDSLFLPGPSSGAIARRPASRPAAGQVLRSPGNLPASRQESCRPTSATWFGLALPDATLTPFTAARRLPLPIR